MKAGDLVRGHFGDHDVYTPPEAPQPTELGIIMEKTEEFIKIFWFEGKETYRYGKGWWTDENLEVLNESR
jgi:hypothetical protein